jgi:hypothetical protein
MKPTLLAAALYAALMLGVPNPAGAQGPRVAPSGALPLARLRVAPEDLRVPPLNLHEMSEYAGWGGTIGAALGVAYGIASERGWDREIEIICDGVIGFTGGLVAGAAVYIAKAVRGSR